VPAKKRSASAKKPPSARTKATKQSGYARSSAEPSPRWRACSRCGRTRPCSPGGVPPGWSFGWDGKRAEYLCVDCSRANIRAIEGRLSFEYWE
jgi:hypothetical protein